MVSSTQAEAREILRRQSAVRLITATSLGNALESAVWRPATMTWLGSFPAIGERAPGYYLTVVCLLSPRALVTIRRTAADAGPY
jgi:hypothetical protein